MPGFVQQARCITEMPAMKSGLLWDVKVVQSVGWRVMSRLQSRTLCEAERQQSAV